MKEKKMTLRELLEMEIDIDCYDDIDEGIEIAMCGPVILTDEGKEHYAAALDLPVTLYPTIDGYWETAVIGISELPEKDQKKAYRAARQLLYDAAGFCTTDEYIVYFEEGKS